MARAGGLGNQHGAGPLRGFLVWQERSHAEEGRGCPNLWLVIFVPAPASWHQVGIGDVGVQGKQPWRDGDPRVRGSGGRTGRRAAMGRAREVSGSADGRQGAAEGEGG